MLLRQFLDSETSTFTYLIANDYNAPAAIIDPVDVHIDLYNRFIDEFGLTLTYCLETHTHADHITASGKLAKQHNASIAVGKPSQAENVDIFLEDNQVLTLGDLNLKALSTPGHTDDSYCFALDNLLFTGDTLFIRGTGRTDFQCGCPRQQYASITEKLFAYPDETLIYPGHDYKTINVSTVGEEKRFNPRLQVANADEYATIMNSLNLAYPKKIDVALPANLKCGLLEK
ncbi:MAG: Zn-dependent hydrolase [Coxiella sp. (in: Bacteria)]|nr:MAG: Zn-dependent hydrolase [Coxiella sp. (in: g-proteobacteria)]